MRQQDFFVQKSVYSADVVLGPVALGHVLGYDPDWNLSLELLHRVLEPEIVEVPNWIFHQVLRRNCVLVLDQLLLFFAVCFLPALVESVLAINFSGVLNLSFRAFLCGLRLFCSFYVMFRFLGLVLGNDELF